VSAANVHSAAVLQTSLLQSAQRVWPRGVQDRLACGTTWWATKGTAGHANYRRKAISRRASHTGHSASPDADMVIRRVSDERRISAMIPAWHSGDASAAVAASLAGDFYLSSADASSFPPALMSY
jgi:hypothetical protein